MSINVDLHRLTAIHAEAWEHNSTTAVDLTFYTGEGDFHMTCFTADLAAAKAYADMINFARKSLAKTEVAPMAEAAELAGVYVP